MTVTVGIDPGVAGAIAILVDGELLETHDMPTVTTVRRSKGKDRKLRSIDVNRAAFLIHMAKAHCGFAETPTVIIERVHGRQGEAAGNAFRFGETFGALCAIPAALGWVWTVVTPQVWKPAVGLATGADKDANRELAGTLFPHLASDFARKKDDGRADAALIAHWWHREAAS